MSLRCETETSVISLKLFVLLCNAPVVIYSYIYATSMCSSVTSGSNEEGRESCKDVAF